MSLELPRIATRPGWRRISGDRIRRVALILASVLPGAAAANDLQGPYMGAVFGFGQSSVENETRYEGIGSIPYDMHGASAGLFAGWHQPLGNGFVLGIEGQARHHTGSGRHGTSHSTEEFETEQEWELSLVGRLGHQTNDLFVYGLAGTSALRLDGRYYIEGVERDTSSSTIHGYVVGIGAERGFDRGGFLRLEARYADYGKVELRGENSRADLDVEKVDLDIGIGWRF